MAHQILTADDHVEIMALLSNYVHCIDSGDIDGFVGNFTSDATLRSASGVATGHSELRAWFLSRQARVGGANEGYALRHFIGMPHIRGGAGRSFAETYCLVPGYDSEGRIVISLVGRYEDICVRVDGQWLFESRTIHGELHGEPSRPIVT